MNKNLSSVQIPLGTTTISETTEYYVHSSALDKVLTELDGQGAKKVTYIV